MFAPGECFRSRKRVMEMIMVDVGRTDILIGRGEALIVVVVPSVSQCAHSLTLLSLLSV